MLTVRAPAKINLTLEVLAKRTDGFHEIRSIIQSINLGDTIRFLEQDEVTIRSDMPEWVAEKSLVSRAVALLGEATGCSKGVAIEVCKRIPLVSGLGGDSSCAAAVLRGLNTLWELGLAPEKLHQLAAELGSDVPFFLYCGTAMVEGRGEVVTPLPLLPRHSITLVIPPVPAIEGKTALLYSRIKPVDYTDGQITARMVEVLKEKREFQPSLLFNVFEKVVYSQFEGLETYRDLMMHCSAQNVHIAGSGPVLFTLVDDKTDAESLRLCFQAQGLGTCIAETSSQLDSING